jgi:hypothetical protein
MSKQTNKDRTRWARDALAVFTAETFNGDHPDTMHRADLQCAIAGLIADLLHLADEKGFDAQRILEQGNTHFTIEVIFGD